MCGIAGIYSFPPRSNLTPLLERMLRLQAHRGPDDRGTWEGKGIALGNLRLAILDLTPAGHQPMSNEDGSLWCVLNGEIYNFQDLQRVLKSQGHTFRSNSDTEVLLHGYEEWGLDLFKRLRGMFAFALWSEKEQRLVLARDRFGIKPIYYHLSQKGDDIQLVFASEIKPVLSVLESAPRPNSRVLHDFLAFGLLDHTDETAFDEIVKVPPAHYLVISPHHPVTATRYWDLSVNSSCGSMSAEADTRAAEEFQQVFCDSVRHHLVSDVPVGSCLSGGLDSSSVVCAANQCLRAGSTPAMIGERQKTFTSCSNDPRYDERAFAHLVAEATGVQEHFTFPSGPGFRKELSDLLWHQEEPFASTSIYAQWCLMRDVKTSGIKVVLDGQGGDEQLLGYGKFYWFFLRDLWRRRQVSTFAREAIGLAQSVDYLRTLNLRHGLKYLGRRGQSLGSVSLLRTEFRQSNAERMAHLDGARDLGERIKQDLTTFSLPVLLRYEDKNSSAFSVEARTPFVDHVVAEMVAALPINQKLRRGWTKYVLRQGMKGILPEPIRLRKSKLGFGTPEETWFRGELAPDLAEAFRSPCFIQEYADIRLLNEEFQKYQNRPGLLSGRVFFRYYIVEMWAKQFILDSQWQQSPATLIGQ